MDRVTRLATLIYAGIGCLVLLGFWLILSFGGYAMNGDLGVTLHQSLYESGLFVSGLALLFFSGLIDVTIINRKNARTSADGKSEVFYCGKVKMNLICFAEWLFNKLALVLRVAGLIVLLICCPLW